MEKTRSSCLWLHGIPGCGKTILTSKVIDTLSERLEKTEALAYCYCDYAEIITLETQTVVKTIVHQILKPLAIPEEVEEKVTKLFIQGNRTPNLDDLLSTIRLAASGFSKVYVVLDGIDECQKQDQQDVLYVINQITSIESPIFKVFVSSREESRISSALDCPRIQVLDDAVHKDIKDFASAGVQSRLDSGEMTIGNLALKEEVISELVAKAHGM
jgi:Cdc6-like AAA superfamily ATPase